MKTLAISNFKGGAGKTTAANYLGLLLAHARHRTLLIDLDPQHNLTDRLSNGYAPDHKYSHTIADVLGQALDLNDAIYPVDAGLPNLFLCPSEFQLANVAYGLTNDVVRGRSALQRSLRAIRDRFDIVLIDCPPEAGILLVNALLAADTVLLPAEPEEAAIAGIRKCCEMITQVREEFGRQTPFILGAIASRVDARTNRHADGLTIMGKSQTAPLLATIPERNGQGRETDLLNAYRAVSLYITEWIAKGAPVLC